MSYAAGSSRGGMGGERNWVVPMAEWMPTAYEVSQPSSQLSFPPVSRVPNHSKTTRKPRRSSPLAGPVLSSDRSISSSSETAPRLGSSGSVSQDADRPLSIRSKSLLGLSRPASVYPPSPHPSSSRQRPSTAPTPSNMPDLPTIKTPPSAMYSTTETLHSERISPGYRGVLSGSSFVSGGSGPRSRASYMSTELIGPSMRPVSVVLEVEAEEEEEDDIADRKSAIFYPESIPNSAAPAANSWYVANEYSETPKFSRLGLAGSNVVMPVSAKERRKQMSRRGSVASIQSSASGNPKSSVNGAGTSLTRYSSSSSTTSDSQGRNGAIKLPWSSNRDTVADVSPHNEHAISRTHKPEWLKRAQTHAQTRGTSLPSPTPTFSSAASSASSLPLTAFTHSYTSSTPSVVSCATACTSVDESEETREEHHHRKGISLESPLVKRKSVLAMVKSWRGTPSPSWQREQSLSDTDHSLNGSSDEQGVFSVCSESTRSVEKDMGVVVYIEPIKASDVKKGDADVVVTPVSKSRSESTIQVVPGNGKRDRRIGPARKIWNTLIGRSSRT